MIVFWVAIATFYLGEPTRIAPKAQLIHDPFNTKAECMTWIKNYPDPAAKIEPLQCVPLDYPDLEKAD